MKFLTPDTTITAKVGSNILTIKQKITPDGTRAHKNICSYVRKGDFVKPNSKLNNGTGKPKGITVHNTGDIRVSSKTTPAEQYCRATYPNGNMGGAAVHYWVWHNDIWQQLADNERGWHAADGASRRTDHRGGKTGGNLDTIAIECIGPHAESEDTLTKLVAFLCNKYGLNPDYDVYTHNYWMFGKDEFVRGGRKNCPAYILDHWTDFLEKVKKQYNDMNDTPVESPSDEPIKVGDIVEFIGTKHYISANSDNSKPCKSGKAEVTRIYNGKHPCHLVAVKGEGSTVYGWVDEADIKGLSENVSTSPKPVDKIKVGDKVKCKSGAKKYTNGIYIPRWVANATLYVREIEKDGTVYLVSTEPIRHIYTGRIYASDVEKI